MSHRSVDMSFLDKPIPEPPAFIVSRAPDDGRVWVANDDFSVVLVGDSWTKDAPSPDDLKDNFEAVEGEEADTWFYKAAAAVSENSLLLRALDDLSAEATEGRGKANDAGSVHRNDKSGMSKSLSELSIVRAVAREASVRLARKVIAELQRMKDTLSGDDSGLKTTWDEICVQVQYEQSFYWDSYDETVRSIAGSLFNELSAHEQEAIWLQTEEGIDWDREEPEDRDAYPVHKGEIIDYLVRECVYEQAANWSNPRIRAYLDGQA